MKILFDNGTPRAIARSLRGHEVTFARVIGWHELVNGELMRRAEEAGFNVLLSTDKNIRYQQNLSNRKIALVILGNSQWPQVQTRLAEITRIVDQCKPGDYIEIEIPFS